ncbi:MAG: hypothetical protein HQL35_14765 [Alphaproteobacteria bacterium]|nr:hypothetical protein [Alphaproteobacteria bacterium]
MAALAALVVVCGGAGQARAAEQVFVLHSYSQEYPWTRGQHQGFLDALQADTAHSFDFKVEYLDTKRAGYAPEYAAMMAAHLKQKYANYRPAAIYVTDDNALSFALEHVDALFPGAPVFFPGSTTTACC